MKIRRRKKKKRIFKELYLDIINYKIKKDEWLKK